MINKHLEIRIAFASETGKRATNQDYVASYQGDAKQRNLYGSVVAIADGVGGSKGGRHAAELTVRSFIDAYYSLPLTLGVETLAQRALSPINHWVFTQGQHDKNLEHMATTFSAMVFKGHQAHIIHVGDSRIYRLRDKQIKCLTVDHVHHHPDMQHVLLRGIGIEKDVRIHYEVIDLKLHDRFLLCTDGVHGSMRDQDICALLLERTTPDEVAPRVVISALAKGSEDNASAIVVDVISLPSLDKSMLELMVESLPILDLPREGQVVDGFQLEQMLSDGRYARLFVAHDTAEDRSVVIKFPHPRVTTDTAYKRAFIREAWIANKVNSPWVTEVLHVAVDRQTRLYSVLPYYRGETLEKRLLGAKKISLEEGVKIGIALGKGIYALNRQRIVHRDIKPDNVLLLADGGLKLLDLGVAHMPGVVEFPEEDIPGTPSYMAPELFAGFVGDDQSDVFALGVTLYRMFGGGRYPYGEIEPFTHPRFKKFISLGRLRPDLPAWLDSLLERSMAVDPKQRLGDAMELVMELEDGLARGNKMSVRRKPLYEKNPLVFWQVLSVFLSVVLIAVLAF